VTTGPRSAAIVLAGGRSSRFGRDKLAVAIDGRSMLEHAIDAVRPVVDEVLVVVAPDATPTLSTGVRLVRDDRAFEGPLAGVATGLAATDAEIVLVVAGDMPSMVSMVLRRLLATVVAPDGPDAAVLASGDGSRPLPMVMRRTPAQAIADSLLAAGERRLRTLSTALGASSLPEAQWRQDDPTGLTLVDVDRPEDLA
jgi:molybdopterin-guanine dinucleotide biosynthesis protein A